jgi:hypothetical protein
MKLRIPKAMVGAASIMNNHLVYQKAVKIDQKIVQKI